MKKRVLEKGEAGFLAALGIFSLISLAASLKVFVSAPTLNGEGTVPLLTSLVLILMTVLIFLEMRGCPRGLDKTLPLGRKAREVFQFLFPGQVGIIIVYCVVYAVLMGFVGFAVSTFAFLAASILTLNRESKIMPFVISAVTVACILVLFQFIFKVQLP